MLVFIRNEPISELSYGGIVLPSRYEKTKSPFKNLRCMWFAFHLEKEVGKKLGRSEVLQ